MSNVDWQVYLLRNPHLCKEGVLTEGDCRRHFLLHGNKFSDQVPDEFDISGSYMDEHGFHDRRAAYIHFKNVGVLQSPCSKYDLIIHHADKPIIIVFVSSPSSIDFVGSIRFVVRYNVIVVSSFAGGGHFVAPQNSSSWITTFLHEKPWSSHRMLFVGEDATRTFLPHLSEFPNIPRMLFLPINSSPIPSDLDLSSFQKLGVGAECIRTCPDQIFVPPLPSDMVLTHQEVETTPNTFFVVLCGDDDFIRDVMPILNNPLSCKVSVFILDKNNHNPYPWLSQCDVLVSSSMCQSVFRAMSCGKVVLVPQSQCAQEFIRHMETGLLFTDYSDLQELMKKILSHDQFRTQIGDNATIECNTRFHKNHFVSRLDLLLSW